MREIFILLPGLPAHAHKCHYEKEHGESGKNQSKRDIPPTSGAFRIHRQLFFAHGLSSRKQGRRRAEPQELLKDQGRKKCKQVKNRNAKEATGIWFGFAVALAHNGNT